MLVNRARIGRGYAQPFQRAGYNKLMEDGYDPKMQHIQPSHSDAAELSRKVLNETWNKDVCVAGDNAHKKINVSSCAVRLNSKTSAAVLIVALIAFGMLVESEKDEIELRLKLLKDMFVDYPDYDERVKILDAFAKDKKLNREVSIETLAYLSRNFSRTELEGWINKAYKYAKHEKSPVSYKHFDKAHLTICGISPIKTNDDKTKREIAIHEAGHALLAYLFDLNIYSVTINSSSNEWKGMTRFICPESEVVHTSDTYAKELDFICVAYAGKVAEELFGFESGGCKHDMKVARKTALRIVSHNMSSKKNVTAILKEQETRAKDLLVANMEVYIRLIDNLVVHNTLYKKEIGIIVHGQKLGEAELIEKKFAEAFTIDSDAITDFQEGLTFDGYRIEFKESFDEKKLEEINKSLVENGISAKYDTIMPPVICVKKDGGKFIEYIKSRSIENSDSQGSSLSQKEKKAHAMRLSSRSPLKSSHAKKVKATSNVEVRFASES
jgi:hypothetical protein